MKIEKIQVSNFRNIESLENTFTSDRVWVVQGANGAGKSSFICDALTFALFGHTQATKGTNRVGKKLIVREGARKAFVRVEFTHQGSLYQIVRSRTATTEKVSVLKDGQWIFQDASNKQLGPWVEQLIGMDLDAFVQTSIIRQNELTSFITEKGAERRELLKKIFRIDRYERYGDLAKERRKEAQAESTRLEAEVRGLQQDLPDSAELQEQKKAIEEQVVQKKDDETTLKEQQAYARKAVEEMHQQQLEKAKVVSELATTQRNLTDSQTRQGQLEQRIRAAESQLQHKELVVKRYAEMQETEQNLQDLRPKTDALLTVEREESQLKQKIQLERSRLEGELKNVQNEVRRVQKSITDLEKQLSLLQEREKADKPLLEEKKQLLVEIRKQLEELLENERKQYELEKKIHSKEKEVEQRLKPLEEELKRRQYELRELEKKEKQLHDLEKQVKKLKERLVDIPTQEELMRTTTAELDRVGKELTRLNLEDKQVEKRVVELTKEKKALGELRDKAKCPRCHQDLSPKHLEELIASIDEEIRSLSSNKQSLRQQQSELQQSLKELTERKAKIEKELSILNNIKITATTKEETVKQLQEELKEFTTTKKRIGELTKLLEDRTPVKDLESEVRQLQDQLKSLVVDKKEIARLRREQKTLEPFETKLQELLVELRRREGMQESLAEQKKELNLLNKKKEEKQSQLDNEHYANKERESLLTLQQKKKELLPYRTKKEELEKKLEEFKSEGYPNKYHALLRIEDQKKGLEDQRKELQNQQVLLQKQILLLQKSLTQYEGVESKVQKAKEALAEVEGKLSTLQRELGSLEQSLKSVEEKITALKTKEGHIKQLLNQKEQKENEVDEYNVLTELFSNISSQIMARLQSNLNLYANQLLVQMGNDQLSGLSLDDEFNLLVDSDLGTRQQPRMFSGGQQVRIAMAFRLSLSKLLASTTHTDLSTLVIDEGDFGALDDDGKAAISDLINSLAQEFSRIILVTHLNEVATGIQNARRLMIQGGRMVPV